MATNATDVADATVEVIMKMATDVADAMPRSQKPCVSDT